MKRSDYLSVLTSCVACLTLTACNSTQRGAEAAVRENLKDPESARFGEFYFNEEQIRTIRCPTLVLWTDKNPIHGTDAADRLEEIIPGSRKHVMKGCAHWPQWEEPELFNQLHLDFLRA